MRSHILTITNHKSQIYACESQTQMSFGYAPQGRGSSVSVDFLVSWTADLPFADFQFFVFFCPIFACQSVHLSSLFLVCHLFFCLFFWRDLNEAQYPTTSTSILQRTTTAHSYPLLLSPHCHTHATMNAGQPDDKDAGNSNVDAGNSGDDDNDGSVNAAGGENARERRGQRVWQHHGSHDNNDDIEYGYPWSRRITTYENCGSSSFTPAQLMEQETYYRLAEVVIHHVVYILQLILLHQASYVRLHLLIGRWSGVSAVSMASAIELARAKMQQIMDTINWLFFVLRWI
jgi:hypothetical protein